MSEPNLPERLEKLEARGSQLFSSTRLSQIPCAITNCSPELAAEIAKRWNAFEAMRKALEFISQQPCERPGDYHSCSDRTGNLCVTEYCLPCYAKAHITQLQQGGSR